MKQDPQEVLLRTAQELADGQVIDWEGLARTYPDLSRSLRNLMHIHSFAQACGLGVSSPAEESSVLAESSSARVDPAGNQSSSRAEHAGIDSEPTSWGPLRVLERVGEGSFGIVYRAHDPLLDRDVALKLRRSDGAEAAAYHSHLEEARRLARVRHPNVLTVYGVEIHDGRVGMWTDFLRGQTLDALTVAGPLEAEEIIRVGIAVSRALAAVHSAGIIHGDVKTANVMREDDGTIVLMDFGAGREHLPAPPDPTRALTAIPAEFPLRPPIARSAPEGDRKSDGPAFGALSSLAGTPLFMAPELFRGTAPSPASDIYSLGVVLYKIATGHHPHRAENLEELLAAHQNPQTVVSLAELRPDLPRVLVVAVERALAVDRSARFDRAVELEAALAAVAPADELAGYHGTAAGERHPSNLPPFDGRFVGRRELMTQLGDSLDGVRPRVLLGPGGCGKSRLAREAAESVRARFPDGVWWVDLSTVVDETQLATEVARVLGIAEQPGRSVHEVLAARFHEWTALLVLDNAETVPEACAQLASAWTATARDFRIWITSRVALGDGLDYLPIPTLTLPSKEDPEQAESVRLFVDRAHRVRPDFLLGPRTLPGVVRICRTLDGVPLAIELAATRMRSLSADSIADRLDRSFELLRGQDRPERHGTLDRCIEWSALLLSKPEQILLARLAVFIAGATTETIEVICGDPAANGNRLASSGGDPPDPGISAPPPEASILQVPVVDLLDRLVEVSLISFQLSTTVPGDSGVDPPPAPRYRMLEMVRRYAQARLIELGEETVLRDSHRRHFLEVAVRAEKEMVGELQTRAFRRLAEEHENLHHALGLISRDPAEGRATVRMAAALGRYWSMAGYWEFGLACYQRFLARPELTDLPEMSKLLTWAGHLSADRADFDQAILYFEQGQALSEAQGDRHGVALALGNLAVIAEKRRQLELARRHFQESLRILREVGDDRSIAINVNNLGLLHLWAHQFEEAGACFGESLAIQRTRKDAYGTATALASLGMLSLFQHRLDDADGYYRESLTLRRQLGERSGISTCLTQLGRIAGMREQVAEARALLSEGLKIRRELGHRLGLSDSIEACARLAESCGEPRRGVRLLAAALALRESVGASLTTQEKETVESDLDSFRLLIGSDQCAYEWQRGLHTPESDAIEHASAAGTGEISD